MRQKLLLLFTLFIAVNGWGQTNNYFGTSGTISGSVWSTNPAGPYTSALVTTGGPILNFNNAGTATGATIATVVGINFGAAITWTAGGTIGAAGINMPINVSSGVNQNLTSSFSSSVTAAFTKNGAGALQSSGNTFGGGFTLNAGTYVLGGTQALGSGTVTLNAGTIAANANRAIANPTSIVVAGDIQFGEIPANVSLASNTATISFSSNISLGGSLRTLTLGNAAAHTFSGIISNSSATGITFAGNANSNIGSFVLTGANTYTGLTTVSGVNLKLNKTGGTTIPITNSISVTSDTLQISSNQTLANLTIAAGGTLLVDAGVTLTITGTLSNNGIIVNNGTITAPSGSLINTATATAVGSIVKVGTITNSVTIQQWITGQRGYRVISNPFNSVLIPSTVGTANTINITGVNDVKTYNSSDNTWSGSVNTIAANMPYAVFIRGLNADFNTLPAALDYKNDPSPFTYSVTGTLNSSSVSITPTTTTGFTLVGNPLAAPVKSLALTGGSASSYYVYNAAQGSTGVRVKAGGWSSALTSSATTPIPIMGVIAYIASSTTSYNIASTDTNTVNTPTTGLFGEENSLKFLELQVSKEGNYHDKLFVRLDATSTDLGNERMDLPKLSNDVTNIYTIASDKAHLAVDARKGIDASIPVGITAPVGTYTFTVASNNLPNAANVYLLDKLLNTKTVLEPGATYSFAITADAASKGDDRFELGAVKTAIQDVITNDAFAVKVLGNVVNNGVTLQVKGAKAAVTITVTDMQGKIISNTTSSNVMNTLSLASGSGMYFIKVTDGDTNIVTKVVKP